MKVLCELWSVKGCWTVPATSTQGTTKEGDKLHCASLSPTIDLAHRGLLKIC
jgi:hypothetical protein